MKKQIGERIKTLRHSQGLQQNDLVKILNISQASLSAYENGKKLPSIDLLVDISKYFDVSLEWLCGLEPKIPLHTGADFINFFLKSKEILDYSFLKNEEGQLVLTFTRENSNFNAKLGKFLMDYKNHIDSMKTIEDDKIRDDLLKLWLERELKEFETVKL